MSNEELVLEIRAGCGEYGKLWQQVQAFVRQQAAGYLHQNAGLCGGAGVEFDDLMQAGFLALHDAVSGFDGAAGLSFMGYLAFHLKRYFREACGIRTSKRDPLLCSLSLDKPVNEEDGAATLGELTPDPQAETEREAVEDRIFHEQLHKALEAVMNTLDGAQATVIRRRFWDNHTLDVIGTDMGISRERVRQLEHKAFRALRKPQSKRLLQSFHEEIISRFAWMGTGWNAWYNTGASSVERAAEKAESYMYRIYGQTM